MAIYDRYLSFLFFRVLIVLFSALCGLFMIVDFFERLEEFLDIAQTDGSVASVAFEFYMPRILSFFDRTAGLVALISAVFVLTWIQRNRELIAIYAGGIPTRRVIRPLLWCVIAVSLFGVVNREVLIPRYKDRLIRDTRNWFGQAEIPVRPTFDRMTGIFLNGKAAIVAEDTILDPNIQLPPSLRSGFDRLVAARGKYLAARDQRPAGYLLTGVSVPLDINEQANVRDEEEPLVLTPRETEWLEPGSCFLVSRITVEDLTKNDANAVYSSTMELVEDFQNPSRNYDSTSRVLVHARFVQPILDLSLLFIGLPIVLGNRSGNVFIAIGWNILLVLLFFLAQLAAHALGTEGFVSPELAAWLPIFIFTPLAYAGLGKLF